MIGAEIADRLHPARLPETFVQMTAADFLLAFGIGLALAGLLVALVSPGRKARPRRVSLAQDLAAARALPAGEAMLRLAEVAGRRGLSLTEHERAALYAPDDATVQALAARLQGGRR